MLKCLVPQNQSLSCSFSDYGAASRESEGVVRNAQDLVDPLVLWLWSGRLANADLLPVARGQHHRDHLVGGQSFSQRGPGGVDVLIQKTLLHRGQQMISQNAKEDVGLDPLRQMVKDGDRKSTRLNSS